MQAPHWVEMRSMRVDKSDPKQLDFYFLGGLNEAKYQHCDRRSY